MSDEIKSCPNRKCGNDRVGTASRVLDASGLSQAFGECPMCGTRGPMVAGATQAEAESKAREAWDALPRDDAPAAPVDAASLVGREFVRKSDRCRVVSDGDIGGYDYVHFRWVGDGRRGGMVKAAFLEEFEPVSRDGAGADAELRRAIAARDHAMERRLGAALGFPRYADDPGNFPGATPSDGVCVGPYTVVELAEMAADRIERLGSEAAAVLADMDGRAGLMGDQGAFQPWRERLRAALERSDA